MMVSMRAFSLEQELSSEINVAQGTEIWLRQEFIKSIAHFPLYGVRDAGKRATAHNMERAT